MKLVMLKRPITITPKEILEPTCYRVEQDMGDEYAVTIIGDWKNPQFSDRADWLFQWPSVTVECNYMSKGVLLTRLDNADASAIRVIGSRGCGIEFRLVRQSSFQSVRAHRCKADDVIVKIDAIDDSDASNMLWFGQMTVMACDAPTTLSVEGMPNNSPRVITWGQLNMHVAWDRLNEQFGLDFKPRKRVHLSIKDRSAAITILSGNLRLDPKDLPGSKAIEISKNARNVLMVNGQILKVKFGDDIVHLVDGGTKVIPWAGKTKGG